MIEDSASVYVKYASLQKYQPVAPGKEYLWKPQVLGVDQLQSDGKDDDGDDDFDDDEAEAEEKEDL